MRHLEPDQLALLTLGETLDSPETDRHLAGCAQCRTEFDAMRNVVGTARTGPRPETLSDPPPEVWERIAAELGLGKPPRRWPLVAAAAVLGIIVGVLGTYILNRDDPPQVIAQAALQPLPGKSGRGVMEMRRDQRVAVQMTGLPAPVRGFYEVWLLDPATKRLVSLGTLDAAGNGEYVLPPSPSRYPVLDISLEPDDGDPRHSTDSYARGRLPE